MNFVKVGEKGGGTKRIWQFFLWQTKKKSWKSLPLIIVFLKATCLMNEWALLTWPVSEHLFPWMKLILCYSGPQKQNRKDKCHPSYTDDSCPCTGSGPIWSDLQNSMRNVDEPRRSICTQVHGFLTAKTWQIEKSNKSLPNSTSHLQWNNTSE